MEVLRPLTALPIEPTLESDFNEAFPHPRTKEDALTDSMVTIRLSDPQFLPKTMLHTEAQATTTSKNEDVESVPIANKIAVSDIVLDDDEEVALHCVTDNQALQSQSHRSASTSILALSINEASGPEPNCLHIRTGSVDSYSSGESAHVDWEELDKNEKEEQKDECSDDVSQIYITPVHHLILSL